MTMMLSDKCAAEKRSHPIEFVSHWFCNIIGIDERALPILGAELSLDV